MKSPREYHLLRKYGITEEQYNEILLHQKGCCAVCHEPPKRFGPKLAVDHDHTTGAIRGLLCFRCNKFVVGRHRDGRLLRAAADYLDSPPTGWYAPKKKVRKRVRKNSSTRHRNSPKRRVRVGKVRSRRNRI